LTSRQGKHATTLRTTATTTTGTTSQTLDASAHDKPAGKTTTLVRK
jgi:hypothetical protein